MRFTTPLPIVPRKMPPADSWWTKPQTREEFSQTAKAEENRITGHSRFGGRKPTHNKGNR